MPLAHAPNVLYPEASITTRSQATTQDITNTKYRANTIKLMSTSIQIPLGDDFYLRTSRTEPSAPGMQLSCVTIVIVDCTGIRLLILQIQPLPPPKSCATAYHLVCLPTREKLSCIFADEL